MGSDHVVAYVRVTAEFDRTALRRIIGAVWEGRGATLETLDGRFEEDDDAITYALSPTQEGGWVAIVESAYGGARIDREVLAALAAQTLCWLTWDCDHAGLYGAKRLSKGGRDVPVTLAPEATAGADIRESNGWEMFTFSGARWRAYRAYPLSARTKRDRLPTPAASEGEQAREAFEEAFAKGDADAALDALAKVRQVDRALLEQVFATSYRLEFTEVATCVVRVGGALAMRCAAPGATESLTDEEWLQLLFAATVVGEERWTAEARAALAPRAVGKAALAAARKRFEDAATTPPRPGDGRAPMAEARVRFRKALRGLR